MHLKRLALGAAAMATLALTLSPDMAAARHRHYRHYASNGRYHAYHSNCHRRSNTTIGTVGGAVGGGLIGNSLTHGSVVGTLAGAGGGAWAGHALGKHVC